MAGEGGGREGWLVRGREEGVAGEREGGRGGWWGRGREGW